MAARAVREIERDKEATWDRRLELKYLTTKPAG
jgi:hypothetical protein